MGQRKKIAIASF